MNEEIKKLIEEESKRYAETVLPYMRNQSLYTNEMAFVDCVKHGANFTLSKWQEANRWRKVEEELPECRDNDYQVLGLLKNGEYKTIWVIKDSIPQIEVFDYHGVTEWKPIS